MGIILSLLINCYCNNHVDILGFAIIDGILNGLHFFLRSALGYGDMNFSAFNVFTFQLMALNDFQLNIFTDNFNTKTGGNTKASCNRAQTSAII